jgi:hypothetical protein
MNKKKVKKKVSVKNTIKKETPEEKIESGFKELYERECKKNKCKPKTIQHCHDGAFYFLGFIGAAIYYLLNATGFWNGVLGLLKAFIWPVFLVYELFKFLLG